MTRVERRTGGAKGRNSQRRHGVDNTCSQWRFWPDDDEVNTVQLCHCSDGTDIGRGNPVHYRSKLGQAGVAGKRHQLVHAR